MRTGLKWLLTGALLVAAPAAADYIGLIPTGTFLGNTTGSRANPNPVTSAGVAAALPGCIGDAGAGGTKGLVPAPGAGDTAAGKFLKADCTFAVPGGGAGTVTTTGAPANNNLTKFSGATSITNTDLSGDVTTSGASAVTLATVNANVGSFTNTSITVNGKGLITAASTGAAASAVAAVPQGRLTLQTGVPVMTADQTAKTTVFYDTSWAGNQYPNWNGSAMAGITITADEISMGLDAGVPHITSGSVYDVFGTASAAICAGPAWTSTTARGSGAGTTELQLKSGAWTNKNSLTHCWGGASGTTDLGAISANQGTYLGSLEATANGQTGVSFLPAGGSGGSNPFMALCNAYNRVPITVRSLDTKASWTNSSTTWVAADASNSNRVTFLDCLQLSGIFGTYSIHSQPGTHSPIIGLNLDSTSAAPAVTQQNNVSTGMSMSVIDNWGPQLGLHFIQAMEAMDGAGGSAGTFFGAATVPTRQLNGMTVRIQY